MISVGWVFIIFFFNKLFSIPVLAGIIAGTIDIKLSYLIIILFLSCIFEVFYMDFFYLPLSREIEVVRLTFYVASGFVFSLLLALITRRFFRKAKK